MAQCPLDPQEDDVAVLAESIRRRGWRTQVSLMLGIIEPLGLMLSQFLLLLMPMVPQLGQARSRRWVRLLENPDELERLRSLVEDNDAL